jgi:hypothetical protein
MAVLSWRGSSFRRGSFLVIKEIFKIAHYQIPRSLDNGRSVHEKIYLPYICLCPDPRPGGTRREKPLQRLARVHRPDIIRCLPVGFMLVCKLRRCPLILRVDIESLGFKGRGQSIRVRSDRSDVFFAGRENWASICRRRSLAMDH